MKTSDQKTHFKKTRPPSVGGRRGLLGCSGGEDGIIETQKESVRKKEEKVLLRALESLD